MTSDEQEILMQCVKGIASLDTNISLLRKELNGRLPKLEDRTDEHEKQLNLWRGAIAVVVFLLLLLGGTEALHIFHVFK